MLTFLLLAAVSQAETSALFFQTSPGARVEVLPTHGPEWFELAILDNRVNLRDQMPRSMRYVKDIESVSVGAGTTYLRIHAERADLDLVLQKSPEGMTLLFSPGAKVREMDPLRDPVPYGELVSPEPPLRRVKAAVPMPIFPLIGDAATYRQLSRDIPLGVETWTGVGEELLAVELQVAPDSWLAADGFRAVLTGPSDRDARNVARLLLAETYLHMGIPHEAVYYLNKVIGKQGPWSPSLPHLQMARAQMGRGDFEAAAEQCQKAAMTGGEELVVLRCLGAISLKTGVPSPRQLALAIEQRAEDGESLLLAAELMMADVDHRGAHRLAVVAAEELKGKRRGLAEMIAGDASYFLGDSDASRSSWTIAARYGFAELVRVRRVMADLSTSPRRTWSRQVPFLEKLAARDGTSSMEANYLLGQIAEYFPDPEAAARHYHSVWDRSAQTALRSDIPERIVALCDRFSKHLENEERWTDLVIFTGVCWRTDIDRLAADTSMSESWARGYVELGLVKEALRIQRRVVRVRNELDREAVGPLIRLAGLYTRSGRPREALETVGYVRDRLKPPERDDPRLLLLLGDAHAAMSNPKEARVHWTKALSHPTVKDRALRSLGLLDAYEGKCASAVLRLTDSDASQRLARSRCALELGRAAEAELQASEVVVNGEDAFLDEGSWLLGAAAFVQRRPEVMDASEGQSGLWAAVLAEEAAARTFDTMLKKKR